MRPIFGELHVHLLNLPAGILPLNTQKEAGKGECDTYRLGVFAGGLCPEGIDHML